MKFNKFLALAAVALLATGCGRKDSSEKIDHKSEDDYEVDENYDFYSRDRITITMMAPNEEGYSNDLISAIEEATNTTIQMDDNYTLGSYSDKVMAKMSTNSLPDVICRAPSRDNMVSQNAALGLYDLLMQHAPDYRRYLTNENWMELTDVKTYEVYSMKNIRQPEYGYSFLIREDWLNKVGKSVPTTWDEFIDVLDAFKTQIVKTSETKFPFIGDPSDLRYTFGINSAYYFATEGDTTTHEYKLGGKYTSVVHSKYYETYMRGMQQLAYYMPEDYLTQYNSIESKMSSDLVGCTVTWSEYAQTATDALNKTDKNAKWIGFNPIVGPDGFSGVRSNAGLVHDFVLNANLSKDMNKAREVVRFLNFFYTDKGIELLNYGKNGVHFDVVNDKKVLKPAYNTFKTARLAGMLNPRLPFYWVEDSYKQMVKGDLSEENSVFYQALGIDKYNFVQNAVSLNTAEWTRTGTVLVNQLETFEKKSITGQYRDVDSNKWKEEFNKIKSQFQEVNDKGAVAYEELLQYIVNK